MIKQKYTIPIILFYFAFVLTDKGLIIIIILNSHLSRTFCDKPYYIYITIFFFKISFSPRRKKANIEIDVLNCVQWQNRGSPVEQGLAWLLKSKVAYSNQADGPRIFSKGGKMLVPSLYNVSYSLNIPILIVPGQAKCRTPKVVW